MKLPLLLGSLILTLAACTAPSSTGDTLVPAEPSSPEPVSGSPGPPLAGLPATIPASTEPASTEPASTEPASTEPAPTEPAVSEPAPPESAPAKLGSPEPVDVDPPEASAPEAAPLPDLRLSLWQGLLADHQDRGGLRYAGLAKDRRKLDAYLDAVAQADLGRLGREEKLAFWINAYNALVARGVLERYPGLESVIKVEGFFDAERHLVAGEDLTLNELERKALDLGDPRVHFAVVCASTGCPDLLGEAFTAQSLEEQLAAQTSAFLGDPSKGLRFDEESGTLWLSSIFDWYAKDFGGDVLGWILPLLPADLAAALAETSPRVKFIDYDWSPNDRSPNDRS